MELQFLGGCREVGRSGILLSTKGTNIILDYGVELQPDIRYPLFPKKKIHAVIPTHCHLDHVGSVPVLFKKYEPTVYMTRLTYELSDLLIKDFLKVARRNKKPLRFSRRDFKKMKRNVKIVDYEEEFQIGDVKIKLYDAGHVPGSAGVLLNVEGKNVFYTGDIKLYPTRLLNGCVLPKEDIDVLIMETTYGDREHPPRDQHEREFRDEVDYALNQEEFALVPVFAIGRAQEMMLVLKGYEKYMVLDGMAKEATRIMIRYNKYLRSPGDLGSIFNKIRVIENDRQRRDVLKRSSVILSTAGMLSGGPMIFYLKKLRNRKDSRVIFVGYQVEGTPGNYLLNTGVFKNDETEFDVKCKIRKFDFSAHAGRRELLEIVKKLRPKKVICVHGDHPEKFAKDVEKKFGIDATAPKNGDKITL